MAEPDDLVYVPLDFERQTLVEGLRAAGYRAEQPAFFSWLGTTQYLTADAVFKTLNDIASLAPAGELVFTYQAPEAVLDDDGRRVLHVLKTRAAQGGVPVAQLVRARGPDRATRDVGIRGGDRLRTGASAGALLRRPHRRSGRSAPQSHHEGPGGSTGLIMAR